jgi:hypothetical protein
LLNESNGTGWKPILQLLSFAVMVVFIPRTVHPPDEICDEDEDKDDEEEEEED